MNDEELLAAVRDTFPTLDLWRSRLSQPLRPQHGSELAADDAVWPYASTSSLAAVGLASAREHLHAIRLLVEAGELFPSATSTLSRSALIGAALSTWLLEPNTSSERLQRSLSLAYDDYTQHLKYGAAVRLEPSLLHPNADEQISRLELRRAGVLELLENAGGLIKINLTNDVIPTALKAAVQNEELRAAIAVRWRSMSGAAHALVWHYFGNDGTTASEVDTDGVGEIAVGGDLERLAMDYFSAFRVAVAGWRLLDQRRSNPMATQTV